MAAATPSKTKGEMTPDPKYDHYDYPTISPVPQNGHPGHTTPEQDAKVFQLRTMLEQEGYSERLDTLSMLRFLRARKFDVQASKKMFIDCEAWRKEFGGGVDDLVRNFEYKEKPQVFEYYPQYYHKTDKDGRPVYIESLGNVDITAMYKITSQERMLQNLVCEYEKMADPRLPACCRKSGKLLETCCTIMDFKNVGISKASQVYGYVQAASAISQNYYPERLGKLYILNAPWGFAGVFAVVKRFLDPVTVAKIHVYGSGYEKDLLTQIPAENLPKQFGGTCECPGGCHLSDMGPWKEEEWYKPAAWEKTPEAAAPVADEKSVIKDQPSLGGANDQPAAGEAPKPAEPVPAPAAVPAGVEAAKDKAPAAA